jgi:hypothetical protein
LIYYYQWNINGRRSETPFSCIPCTLFFQILIILEYFSSSFTNFIYYIFSNCKLMKLIVDTFLENLIGIYYRSMKFHPIRSHSCLNRLHLLDKLNCIILLRRLLFRILSFLNFSVDIDIRINPIIFILCVGILKSFNWNR